MTDGHPPLILWLDPGLATGWATWYPSTGHFDSGVIDGLIDTASFACKTLRRQSAVGWEAFTIRPGSSRLRLDTTALEVIGAVKWIAYERGSITLKPAQPADRNLGKKHLQTLGWHRPGPDHADSAASHLLAYLVRERQLPTALMAKITSQKSLARNEERENE